MILHPLTSLIYCSTPFPSPCCSQMDEIQLVLQSIVEEKERLRGAHEAQIHSMEQRHAKAVSDLKDLKAQALETEMRLLVSEEKRTTAESFLDQLKLEYQRLLADHDSLQQQLVDKKSHKGSEAEVSDGGSSSFYSAGEASQGGGGGGGRGGAEEDTTTSHGGSAEYYSGGGEGGSVGGTCEGVSSGGATTSTLGASLGGGSVVFYPDPAAAALGGEGSGGGGSHSTLNPLFQEEEEEGPIPLEEGDLPLPLSAAPTFLFPLDPSSSCPVEAEAGHRQSREYDAVSSSLNNPLFDNDSRRATLVLTPETLEEAEVNKARAEEERVFDPAFTFSRNSSCFEEEVQPIFNLTSSAAKQQGLSPPLKQSAVAPSALDPSLMTDEEIVAYSKSLTSRILNEVHSLAGQLEAVRSTSPFAPPEPSPPPTHRYPASSTSNLSEALGKLKEHLAGLQCQNRVGREDGSSDWGSVDASGSLAKIDQGRVAASPWKSPAWPVSMTPLPDRTAFMNSTNAYEARPTMRPLIFDSPTGHP